MLVGDIEIWKQKHQVSRNNNCLFLLSWDWKEKTKNEFNNDKKFALSEKIVKGSLSKTNRQCCLQIAQKAKPWIIILIYKAFDLKCKKGKNTNSEVKTGEVFSMFSSCMKEEINVQNSKEVEHQKNRWIIVSSSKLQCL